MSKKTHQKELERARAKRQAEAYATRQKRLRVVGIIAILALAVGVFAVAALSGGDDPEVAIDEFGFDDEQDVDGSTSGDSGTSTDDGTAQASADVCQNPSQGAPESPRKSYDAAPDMVIDPEKQYVATIDTTCGTVVVALDAAMAPTTVNNFVFLAQDGYYDGAPFHRVIDTFMIQGGDPSGTGHGEGGTFPGYTFEDELALAQQVVEETGGYPRGTLAMANSGPDTNGSQFFIMQAPEGRPYPLPPNYAVFGEVLSGMDVVDRIALGPVVGDQAVDPVRIIAISIEES